MHRSRPSGSWVIFISFFTALLLTGLPLPEWLRPFRPDWVSIVLIYWCLAAPERVSMIAVWGLGLLVDILSASLFGLNAFTLVLIAFLAIRLHLQIRIYPLWQQALSVFVLIALSDLLIVWIKSIIGTASQTVMYWGPALMSAILWPWLYLMLRDIRQRFNVR